MGLDPTVLRAVRVGDARLRLAKAFGDQRRGVESLRRQIGNDRVRPALRKTLIVVLGAGRVGVAVDLEFLPFKPRILQRLGELVEICFAARSTGRN